MKLKVKKMKTAAYGVGAGKMDAKARVSCSSAGVRHSYCYHCKKCIFEAIYCSK